MLRKQFVTRTETYGGAYQILNGDNRRTPRTSDNVMTMLITAQSGGHTGTRLQGTQGLGYKAELQGNMFRSRTGWNVMTKADV